MYRVHLRVVAEFSSVEAGLNVLSTDVAPLTHIHHLAQHIYTVHYSGYNTALNVINLNKLLQWIMSLVFCRKVLLDIHLHTHPPPPQLNIHKLQPFQCVNNECSVLERESLLDTHITIHP